MSCKKCMFGMVLLSTMLNAYALPFDQLTIGSPDESEETNDDNLPYRVTDVRYPIPLKEGESIPDFSLKEDGNQGHARVSRQVSPSATLVDYLFFANRQFLVKINRDGTGIQAFQLDQRNNVIAVDYDIRYEHIFWSDVLARVIACSKMDGANLTSLVNTGITVPDGIAWDWVTKKLYWTDAEERDIEVYEPGTGYRKVLIRTGTGRESIPRALVLDPGSRWMYWTDWGSSPRIERASMDGTSRTTLHNTGLQWPNGLTLDLASQTLYWVDAGFDRIESSNSNGTNRRVLTTSYIFHPFGIDIFRGRLYWTDWQTNAVLSASVAQPTSVGVVISNLIFDPMGVKVISTEKQPAVTNPCASSNCSHLCLLSTSDTRGYKCYCPEGSYLSTDRMSCISTGRPPVYTPPTNDPTQCTPPCGNGGSCTRPGVCTCVDGWTGNRCQQALCVPPCLNGGTCTGPGSCSCTSDWEGFTCDQAVCEDGFCMNGGTCIQPGLCSCPTGWSGTRCDQPVCTHVCEHGSCTGPNTCTCSHGWTGDLCNEAVCNPPCENGDCVRPDECVCHSGWDGRLCDDPVCERDCLNGGDCVSPNTCECHDPYYGPTCAQVNCFPPSGCLNGGICVSFSQCACPVGWGGVRCEIPMCGSIMCLHGTCRAPNSCSCNTGWEGSQCDQAICFPPDGCLHGGQCITPGICSCPTGWTGERCQIAVCSRGCNHGNCIRPEQCQCDEGWTGSTCNDAICIPECLNEGFCVRPNLCVCQVHYSGFRCEYYSDPDE